MNKYGYTPAILRNTLPYAIAAKPEAIQFGPFAGRDQQHTMAQYNLAVVLKRLKEGAGQGYVDCVAAVVYEWITTVYYVPHSSCGCNEDNML